MKNKIISFFFISTVLLSSIQFLVSSNLINLKLNWDEVDYISAAKKGVIENAFDFQSTNLFEFIKIGYFKTKNDKEKVKKLALKLPEQSNDTYYLRHFHPVLPVYYWSFFLDKDLNIQDNKIRISNAIIYTIVISCLIFFCFFIKEIKTYNLFLIFLFLSSIFTNNYIIHSFSIINYHTFYSLILIFHIFCLIKFYQRNSNINFYFLAISLSLLIITLETFAFSLVSLFISIILLNKNLEKKISLKNIFNFGILSFVLSIFLWPSIILNGTIVKTFLSFFYRLFFQSNAEYENIKYFIEWKNFFVSNYLFFLLIISILLINIILRNKFPLFGKIPLIYAFTYAFIMTPFIMNQAYLLPFIISLIFSCVIILSFLKFDNIIGYLVFIFISLFSIINIYTNQKSFLNFTYYANEVQNYNHGLNKVIEILNQTEYTNKNILADGDHIFKHYTKNKNIYNLSLLDRKNPSFYSRSNYSYVNLEDKIKNNFFNLIIIDKYRNYKKSKFDFLKKNNYVLHSTLRYNVFILKK